MTYLWISVIFLGVAAVPLAYLWLQRRRKRTHSTLSTPAVLIGGLGLLLLTAIFDNIMIHTGLFYYDEVHLSGLKLGLAPIEDFAYPLAAIILLPTLWVLLRRKES